MTRSNPWFRGDMSLSFVSAVTALSMMGCGAPSGGDAAPELRPPWVLRGALVDDGFAGGSVLALSDLGHVAEGEIGLDGSFAVELHGGATHAVHFLDDGVFAGLLYFASDLEGGGMTSALRLPQRAIERQSAGGSPGTLTQALISNDGELALGDVAVEGGIATAANNPLAAIDSDGDGVADIHDPDDDNDGNPDELEDTAGIDTSAVGLLVASIEPAPGATDVDASEKIEIVLNQVLDAATVTASSVQLLADDGSAVACSFELDEGKRVIKLRPASALNADATYQVSLSAEVASAEGVSLGGAGFSSTFRVAAADSEDNDADSDVDVDSEEVSDEDGEDEEDSEEESNEDSEVESDEDSEVESDEDSEGEQGDDDAEPELEESEVVEQEDAGQEDAEQPENAEAAVVDAEQADAEQANAEQANAEPADAEQADAAQADAEQADAAQENPEQADAAQENPEEANPESAEQANAEQDAEQQPQASPSTV